MAGDFITMQNRIADEIDDTALTSEIKNCINSAIQNYKGRRFYFNQKISTFATVSGREYYDVSDLADIPLIIAIDAMSVNLDGNWLPVLPADFGTIDANQTGGITGTPSGFAYYGQRIRLYPIPNVGQTIRLAYHCQLAPLPLSANGDTNAWLTEAEILIRQCAKRYLAIDSIAEDTVAQAAGALESEALDALQAETRRRMSNDRLRTELVAVSRRRGYSILRG